MMMERYADAAALGEHMQHVGDALGAVIATATPTNMSLVGDVPDALKQGLAAMGPTYLKVAFSQ